MAVTDLSLPSPRTVAGRGRPRRRRMLARLARLRGGDRIALGLFALLVAVTTFGPLLMSTDPRATSADAFAAPGSAGHLLGTDESGRDLLVRLLVGTRTSLWSAIGAVAAAMVIGALVGLVAGAWGGWIDWLLMRVTEVFLALPGTLLAIAVVASFGASLRNTLLAVTAVWWPWYARIVRNEVWALSHRPHLDAARLAGVGPWRRARRHLLPGVWAPLFVTGSLDVGALVLVLSGLSFFGLGAPPPTPELGAMTARGLDYLLEYWWIPVLPALGISVLAFTANLAGEAVRSLTERT